MSNSGLSDLGRLLPLSDLDSIQLDNKNDLLGADGNESIIL